MSLSLTDTQELETIMEEYVLPDVRQMYRESAILLNLFDDNWKTRAVGVNTLGIRVVAKVQPLAGHAWRMEGQELSSGGSDKRVQMKVKFTEYSLARNITGTAIDTTSEHALITSLGSYVSQDMSAATSEWNKQMYRDERAIIARVASRPDATHFVLGLPFRAQQVPIGAFIAIHANTAGVRNAGGQTGTNYAIGQQIGGIVQVTGRNEQTGNITVTGAHVDVNANDMVCFANHGATSYGRGLHGLPYHADNNTGDYQGQSRATYTNLQASVLDRATGALRIEDLDYILTQTVYESDMQDNTDFVMISSPAQTYAYRKFGYDIQRITVDANGKPYDRGFTQVSFGGRRWIEDPDCPPDDIYFLRRKAFFQAKLVELSTWKPYGRLLNPKPGTVSTLRDEFTIYYAGKCDIGCDQPNILARMKNLGYTNLPIGRQG